MLETIAGQYHLHISVSWYPWCTQSAWSVLQVPGATHEVQREATGVANTKTMAWPCRALQWFLKILQQRYLWRIVLCSPHWRHPSFFWSQTQSKSDKQDFDVWRLRLATLGNSQGSVTHQEKNGCSNLHGYPSSQNATWSLSPWAGNCHSGNPNATCQLCAIHSLVSRAVWEEGSHLGSVPRVGRLQLHSLASLPTIKTITFKWFNIPSLVLSSELH